MLGLPRFSFFFWPSEGMFGFEKRDRSCQVAISPEPKAFDCKILGMLWEIMLTGSTGLTGKDLRSSRGGGISRL